jgi:hypothetical protein
MQRYVCCKEPVWFYPAKRSCGIFPTVLVSSLHHWTEYSIVHGEFPFEGVKVHVAQFVVASLASGNGSMVLGLRIHNDCRVPRPLGPFIGQWITHVTVCKVCYCSSYCLRCSKSHVSDKRLLALSSSFIVATSFYTLGLCCLPLCAI